MESKVATPGSPARPEPTREAAVGMSLYEAVRAYFDDPGNAARFEEWRKSREAVA